MNQYRDELRTPVRLLLEHLTSAGVDCVSAADILTALGQRDAARQAQMAIADLVKEHGWHKSESRMVHGVRGTFYVKDPRQFNHTTASPDVLATAPKAPPAREPARAQQSRTPIVSKDLRDNFKEVARQTHDMQFLITGILETFEGWKWWFRGQGVKVPDNCRMPVKEAPTGKHPPYVPTSCSGCEALAAENATLRTRLERIEEILRAAGADIPANESTTENAP